MSFLLQNYASPFTSWKLIECPSFPLIIHWVLSWIWLFAVFISGSLCYVFRMWKKHDHTLFLVLIEGGGTILGEESIFIFLKNLSFIMLQTLNILPALSRISGIWIYLFIKNWELVWAIASSDFWHDKEYNQWYQSWWFKDLFIPLDGLEHFQAFLLPPH